MMDGKFEQAILNKREWKHRKALIAVLGNRLECFSGYRLQTHIDSMLCEWEIKQTMFSSSRPVVSWAINRLGKPPSFSMGTETCAVHDAVPVQSRPGGLDGCRFRDDYIASWMARGGVDPNVESPRSVKIANHRDYFYPVLGSALDYGVLDTTTRMFAAYPRELWDVVADTRTFSKRARDGEIGAVIEAVANRYLAYVELPRPKGRGFFVHRSEPQKQPVLPGLQKRDLPPFRR